MSKTIYTSFFLLIVTCVSWAQNNEVLDQIVAIVGDEIVLSSQVRERELQMKEAGVTIDEEAKCQIVEELLFTKMLLNQAAKDSIFVSEQQVDYEMNRRMRFFISQFGSQEKMERFYGKSIIELKSELRPMVEEQLLVQQMQQSLTAEIKVTPSEVRTFFDKLPKDSLPYIDSEVSLAQIVKEPPISKEEITRVKEKLNGLLKRVREGEDFGTLAFLYSEDPGSSRENGELGFMTRDMLVPEFSRVLFNMQPGEVSEIVETPFGYHIIQMIEKRGQEVNSRHILIKPKVKAEDLYEAKLYLDSIYNVLQANDTITFEEMAELVSDDKDTRNNGGVMINPMTGTSRFQMDELSKIDPSLFFVIGQLKAGEISKPESATLQDGTKVYRIIKVNEVTEPHVANMQQDYQRLQSLAKVEKENTVMGEWVNDNINSYYIKIDEQYQSCPFIHNWPVN